MVKRVGLAAVLVVSALGVTALGADLYPPGWRDADPAKTLQIWEFNTPLNPTAADVDLNPNGVPVATVTGALPKTRWKATDLGATGVWVTEDFVELYIPNTPIQNPEKLIRLQITWWADGEPELLILPPAATVDLFNSELLPGGYTHSTYDIVLPINPPEEIIYILPKNCTVFIDEIVVDTWCVPEPATVAALAAGGLLLVVRRRRRD